MLSDRPPDSYPGFIKWMIRDIAINLLFHSEHLDPRDFPTQLVARDLQKAVDALKTAFPLLDLCLQDGTEIDWIQHKSSQAELDGVIEGLKISYRSHECQRGLDDFLQKYWWKPS